MNYYIISWSHGQNKLWFILYPNNVTLVGGKCCFMSIFKFVPSPPATIFSNEWFFESNFEKIFCYVLRPSFILSNNNSIILRKGSSYSSTFDMKNQLLEFIFYVKSA